MTSVRAIAVLSVYIVALTSIVGYSLMSWPMSLLLSAGLSVAITFECAARRILRASGPALLAFVAMVWVVAAGRVVGGQPRSEVVLGAWQATAFVSALLVAATCLVGLASPGQHLALLSRLYVPKSALYVVCASLGLVSQVSSLLRQQVAMLGLKIGHRPTLVQRFLSYRRILLPLLVVLLVRQHAHAGALADRGFFEQVRVFQAPDQYSTRACVVAVVGLLLAGFLLWLEKCAMT